MSKQPSGQLRIVALLCTRNEELHIAQCLDDLLAHGIEAILIDNSSEDRTLAIAQNYLGRGLLSIESLEWNGCFSLQDQILAKQKLIERLTHDWVIHIDADEWLCPPEPWLSLSEAIKQVDRKGFNCINFDEMTLVPWPEDDFTQGNYRRAMLTYYFFEPRPLRLMRAWRRDSNAKMTSGHRIKSVGSQINVYPVNFTLRHYIALSHAHAVQKYVKREFAPEDLARGWHEKRREITAADLILKPSPLLRRLDRWDSAAFDRTTPAKTHFWQW